MPVFGLLFLCVNIFFLHDYIPKYLMTLCALILSSSRWHCLIHNDNVMFHSISPGIKQKNIIRTGLNGFTAEQLLYAVKYTFYWIFDGGCGEWASSDQNVDYEVIENDCFENMVEIVNMSQWKCALTMTAMVKPSAQIEPLQVSKGSEICFILLFCNCA